MESCPTDTLFSEEDRSAGEGLFEKSRRNVSPTLEARLGRVSSFCVGGDGESRTIPENGTADNLSFPGGDLVDSSFGGDGSLDCWVTFWADSILGSEYFKLKSFTG